MAAWIRFALPLLCILALPVSALAQGEPSPEAACGALAGAGFEGVADAPTRVLTARMQDVPASGLPQPPGPMTFPVGASPIKRFCQVIGYVAPQNAFELRLPVTGQWNGKLFFSACAGFCGTLNGTACNAGLARGYASVTTNGGHDSALGFDGLWARNAPDLQEEFAWRGNHVVTLAAKAITAKFYGRPIAHSYMAGCSKGGQAVLMEAERFPDDFDGLIAAAPVYDYTGRSVIAGAWFAQAVSDGHGGSVLNGAAADAVHRSVLAKCGAQAGVDEGLVTDPLACGWKPETIACAQGASGPDCLTSAQVRAITRLMSPAVNSRGEVLFAFPYLPGTETEWQRWNYTDASRMAETARVIGSPPEAGNLQVAQQYMRYLNDAQSHDAANPLDFDFDRDPVSLVRARALYDATSPDLRGLKAAGGKLLMWHGLADSGISAMSSVGYYRSVAQTMGGVPEVDDFFRLFLVPGVHHCGGGPGPSELDTLSALENWVEGKHAPDVIVAQRSSNGTIERTRPVYPYPAQARYSGHGDPMRAESFVRAEVAMR